MPKGYCFYSLVLVFIFLTALNLYLLKTLDKPSIYKNFHIVPVLFSDLPSDSTGHYRIWTLPKDSKLQDIKKNTVRNADLTIVSQTSVSNLPDVTRLMDSWTGSASIAVFAPGKELRHALDYIRTLQSCSERIRNLVQFQLVLVSSHPPQHDNLLKYWKSIKEHPQVCGTYLQNEKKDIKNLAENYGNEMVPYPVNLLRNVALGAVETSHVLVIDIDMVPSPNLLPDFQKHFESIRRPNGVYVLPAFELQKYQALPRSKTELIKTWKAGNARPFYEKVCWKCQRYTDYQKWKELTFRELAIAYPADWHDPWEPFFIAEKKIIHYDERFKQYGFNRISQTCEIHFSGHSFFILDNAFLIHWGFKEVNQFHKNKNEDNARNRILYRKFKQELQQKYPESTRHC